MSRLPGVFALLLVTFMLRAGPGFDPVKDVPISVSNGVLTLSVPKGVHLKTRLLRVTLASPGSLRLGALPPPSGQDEAGDPIWRGVVKVRLNGSGMEDPARLTITYQPCTEGPDGQCFLPVKRTLAVPIAELSAEAP